VIDACVFQGGAAPNVVVSLFMFGAVKVGAVPSVPGSACNRLQIKCATVTFSLSRCDFTRDFADIFRGFLTGLLRSGGTAATTRASARITGQVFDCREAT
jgi:hypothetical protein